MLTDSPERLMIAILAWIPRGILWIAFISLAIGCLFSTGPQMCCTSLGSHLHHRQRPAVIPSADKNFLARAF